MTDRRQRIGRWGEEAAAHYLSNRGYSIRARNVRTPHGEIDIVACLDGVLVFVEVKTRTNRAFGFPEEAVGSRKQAHMRLAAEHYLQTHPEAGDTWQFDVIAVEGDPTGSPAITHFENVIA